MNINTKKAKGNALLLLTAFIWGIAFVAQSAGMDYVGPFAFLFARSVLGGLVLIPCIFLMDHLTPEAEREKKRQMPKRPLLIGGVCCGCVLFLASSLQQYGIQYTTVGKAGFITALYIIIVPFLRIFTGQRIRRKLWISVALAVVGMYFLCITEGFSISAGDFLELLCAVAFACHILVIDHFSPQVDGVRMSCIQFLVCGLLSGVCMLITEHPEMPLILQAWQPILYAGVFSCGVGYTLQIVGQKGTDPTVASLILSLESVVSVLAGWLLLGQRLSVRELSGCALMFVAILLAQLPERRQS